MRGSRTARGWVLGILVVYAFGAAVVLLSPVSYSGIVHAIADWLAADLGLGWFGSGWIEFGANVALFVPLGFALALLIGRSWWSVLIAVAVSAGAEIVQSVIPRREPSVRDVMANALGALLGVLVARPVRRLIARPVRRLSAQPLDDASRHADDVSHTRPAVEDREH